MRFILFILFIAMPFVEIALLIKLGEILGFWQTIGIVVVTAIVGAYVLQAQGAATLRRVSQSMTSGEPPIKPVVDGFFLAISGAFLLTPGVVTDAIGLLLLVPPVRHAIARWGFGRLVKSANFTVHTYQSGEGPEGPGAGADPRSASQPGPRSGPRPGPRDNSVIDAEYEEVKNKKP
ncbi:MAG: FxsA family protein [Hyphomicrobiaceae bacterium]